MWIVCRPKHTKGGTMQGKGNQDASTCTAADGVILRSKSGRGEGFSQSPGAIANDRFNIGHKGERKVACFKKTRNQRV